MLSTVLSRALCAISFALISLAPSTAAPRESDEQVAIVGSLYKTFAWQVLSSSINAFGKPLAQQESSVLRRYFAQELASLLVKDGHCAAKTGEICNLDFDPIFASQDPAAVDLTIRSMPKDIVAVEFTYPSSGEKVRLEYRMARKKNGWRIDDIRYPGMSDSSLKQLLARKLPSSDK
ncbi:hypothetical protein ABIB42_002620 [Massilia sp. UYP32]|uniref:DUF3828 domain-containing protein n=1 Tax=Massilia sp. UYP32 TaxID=1756386 RepID=UPI003D22CD21